MITAEETGAQLQQLKAQLARIASEEVRSRLHKAVVLWEMGYVRESLSLFRVSAEHGLARLLDAHGCQPDVAAVREDLARGKAGKVIEWLYRDAAMIPARVALHLHTLLGWGSYASHHQAEGHRALVHDFAILTSIALDLERSLAEQLEPNTPFYAPLYGVADQAAQFAANAGVSADAARLMVEAAEGAVAVQPTHLHASGLGLELYWSLPEAGADGATAGAYRGLSSYQPWDADRFYGREEQVAEVTQALEQGGRILLCGASGAGKTSLLRAAVVPWALRRNVATLLLSDYGAASLRGTLDVLSAWPSAERLLLVFDQLERGLFEDRSAAERDLLMELLLRVERWPGVSLAASLREDYLGRLYREAVRVDPQRASALQQRYALFVLGPLTHAQAKEAILRPLRRDEVDFDEAFVDRRLLPELGADGGAPTVHLQLVCGALLEEAKRREVGIVDDEIYDALGGAQNVLECYLDRVLQSPAYQRDEALCRAALKCMASSQGRLWADLGRLWQTLASGGHAVDEVLLSNLLRRLLADRLIVTRVVGAAGIVQYSLTHDVMAPKVLSWRTHLELEQQRAQQLMDRAIEQWVDPAHREPLSSRSLLLVEKHWNQLELNDPTPAQMLLEASRRLRWVKRLSVSALLAVAMLGAIFGFLQLRRAVRAHDRASRSAELGALLHARLALARDPSESLAWLRTLAQSADGVGLRALFRRAQQLGVARVVAGHGALVTSVAFAPDGSSLVTTSRDRTIRRWSVPAGSSLGNPWRGHQDFVTRAVIEPAGKIVASASADGTVRFWTLASGTPWGQPLRGHGDWVYDIAFSSDGRYLVSASLDGRLRIWDWRISRAISTIPASEKGLLAVVFCAKDRQLLTAGIDGVIRRFSWKGEIVASYRGHGRGVYALVLAPDGKSFATGSLDGTVRIWSLEQNSGPIVLRGHRAGVIALAYSRDGRFLASGGEGKRVLIWDVARRRVSGAPLLGHVGLVRGLAFSPDGRTLASVSQDRSIRLWQLASRRRAIERPVRHQSWVQAMAVSPNGRRLAVGTRAGSIVLRDAATLARVGGRLLGHDSSVEGLAFGKEGRLASVGRGGSLRIWSSSRETLATAKTPQGGALRAVAFNGTSTIFTGAGDGTLLRWSFDGSTLRPVGSPLGAHDEAVLALQIAHNGKWLASGARDGTVRLWRLPGLSGGDELAGHAGAVHALRFSPDGRLLAAAGGDALVRLWSLHDIRAAPRVLRGHQHGVLALAFAPGGALLASGGADNTVRLWDPRTPKAVGPPLYGHGDWVYALAFSPDGKRLLSGAGDGQIRSWSMTSPGHDLRVLIDALTNLRVNASGTVAPHK